MQVREAYAAKGWGVPNLNDIDQCRKDKYLDDLRSGFGEGCQVFGNLKINKVAGKKCVDLENIDKFRFSLNGCFIYL